MFNGDEFEFIARLKNCFIKCTGKTIYILFMFEIEHAHEFIIMWTI